jgi:hypothetical protein
VASKDAGISSAKAGENPAHRKPKVSAVQFVCCRSVGPKARPFGVVDGCQVYIPEPGVKVDPGRTLSLGVIWLLVCQLSQDRSGSLRAEANSLDEGAEKSRLGTTRSTVPQTDTGRQVEDTKVFEITLVKELGNLTP